MSATREPTTTLTVRLPASVKERLEELARATGRSRTSLAVDAMRRCLDVEMWQIAKNVEAVRRADDGELAPEQHVAAVREKFR